MEEKLVRDRVVLGTEELEVTVQRGVRVGDEKSPSMTCVMLVSRFQVPVKVNVR